jgi:hypothetical protein
MEFQHIAGRLSLGLGECLLVFLARRTYALHQLQMGNVHTEDERADKTKIHCRH